MAAKKNTLLGRRKYAIVLNILLRYYPHINTVYTSLPLKKMAAYRGLSKTFLPVKSLRKLIAI